MVCLGTLWRSLIVCRWLLVRWCGASTWQPFRKLGMLLALVVLATQAMRLPTKLVFEPPSPNAQVAHKHLIIGTRDLLLSDAAMAKVLQRKAKA